MVAITDRQKARLFDLLIGTGELVRDGKRNPEEVLATLQSIKNESALPVTGTSLPCAKNMPFKDFSPNEQWKRVYKIVCGKKVDCAGIKLPPQPDFACWPILVMPEVPMNAMFAGLKSKFACQSYWGNDLERAIDWQKEERDARKEPYGVWVSAVVEATEDLNNLSALTVSQRGFKTTTLHERLCLEAFYWVLTGGKKGGKHLDPISWNICPGSRYSVGRVPLVGSCDGWVCVDWRGRGDAYLRCGTRQVVTL